MENLDQEQTNRNKKEKQLLKVWELNALRIGMSSEKKTRKIIKSTNF